MTFLSAFSHIPEYLSPVIFSFGPVELRWYGLMYAVAFSIVYYLVSYRIRTERLLYTKDIIVDLIFWMVLGVLLGGRIGYVLFYNFPVFLADPLNIFLPFSLSDGLHYAGISGMSYHGGLIGLLIAVMIFCGKRRIDFWRTADLFCSAIPLGYTFGRLGNFLNGELWGRTTRVPWGMYFPMDPSHQMRHPSQIYEAFFEGILLFLILWSLRKKKVFDGFLFSLYLIGYGIIRFIIEFFREPDAQLGFILWQFSMGQIFCFLMILCGIFVFCRRKALSKIEGGNIL